jgi:hypothetical protein
MVLDLNGRAIFDILGDPENGTIVNPRMARDGTIRLAGFEQHGWQRRTRGWNSFAHGRDTVHECRTKTHPKPFNLNARWLASLSDNSRLTAICFKSGP